MIPIDISSFITAIFTAFASFWNFLDHLYITPVNGVGFTLLQLFIGIYVVSWAIYLFFLGADKEDVD